MKQFEIIWYNMDQEITRDIISADNKEDAERKGFLKYNGNPPAKMHTIIEQGAK